MGLLSRRRDRDKPVAEKAAATPAVKVFQAVVIEPEEGNKLRVSSAADVDPNVKARGLSGVPRGDAGGYGGAGTSSG